jgi:hypothetical protein
MIAPQLLSRLHAAALLLPCYCHALAAPIFLLLCCSLQLCEVLHLVLIPCTDIRTVCSLLQVSTAVRRTVQCCRAGCKVDVKACSSTDETGFKLYDRQALAMHWLPRHAGLVTDLTFHVPTDNKADVHVDGSYALLESARGSVSLAQLSTRRQTPQHPQRQQRPAVLVITTAATSQPQIMA